MNQFIKSIKKDKMSNSYNESLTNIRAKLRLFWHRKDINIDNCVVKRKSCVKHKFGEKKKKTHLLNCGEYSSLLFQYFSLMFRKINLNNYWFFKILLVPVNCVGLRVLPGTESLDGHACLNAKRISKILIEKN